jgi:hypothetical protein
LKKTVTNIFVFLSFLISIPLCQVQIGDWNAFTSPLKINSITSIGDSIICATSGGLLIKHEEQVNTISKIDGIYGVDIVSIGKDDYHNIWLGGNSPNGFIQIYNFKDGSIDVFDYGLTSISQFWISDSLAFASFVDGQDVGLIKFIYENQKWSYRDIYRNFPSSIESILGFYILNNDMKTKIFLGTNVGLLVADISSNLKDPNNWNREFCCFNDGPVKAMCNYKDGLAFIYEGESSGVHFIYPELEEFVSEELNIQLPSAFDKMIFDNENFLIGIKNKNIFSQKLGFEPLSINQNLNELIFDKEGNILVGTDLGLRIVNNITFNIESFLPNAPISAKFTAIEVLDDGRFVGANSRGISIKDFDGWRNILEVSTNDPENINTTYDYSSFVADFIPFDFGYSVADIEQGPDGLVYLAVDGTYPVSSNPERKGGGILVIDIDNPLNTVAIDTSILSYYTSSSSDRPYIVVKDLEFDRDGNLWVANAFSTNKNAPIHVKSPDGDWKAYGSSETQFKISQSPISLSFDSWDRPWFGAFKAGEANLGTYPDGGIFGLTYEGEPSQPESFLWESVLTNATVWSIAFGKNNRLFYLTPTGLNYYDIILGGNNFGQNLYSYFPNISFGGGSKIEIDEQGNVWTLSTTQGIHVLLENTTYWPNINGLRENNSLLLSDEIYDIAFDKDKKLAYIATSKGVSVLRIPFGDSYNDNSRVKIFPSPFLTEQHESMIIDGVVFNSSAKIMTLDGQVIRDIKSRGMSIDGDQIKWDGKSNDGITAPSGVYLVSVIGANGKNKFEKITVINK